MSYSSRNDMCVTRPNTVRVPGTVRAPERLPPLALSHRRAPEGWTHCQADTGFALRCGLPSQCHLLSDAVCAWNAGLGHRLVLHIGWPWKLLEAGDVLLTYC